MPEGERLPLLHELVPLDAYYRRLAGDRPRADDYQARFPGLEVGWLAAALDQALPSPAEARDTPPPGSDPQDTGPPDSSDATGSNQKGGGSPAAASYPPIPGYVILKELGRGGMGVVYQAVQTDLKRLVALKMILAGPHAGEPERDRFRREAEAVARMQHPHIVQIHEVGEHQGLPFLALEFCPGGSLDKKLAGTPLPPQEAARLVEVLAKAMHAAHQQQVIHRDLKPANVLLAADGTPKITDFGLAKRLDNSAGQTATGVIVGTPSYMAPEQADGRTKEFGPASDVYALGAVLYECLTGRPPFRAESALETLLQVRGQEPVPPRQLQPKVPRDLETICLKCLYKETAQRYATAEALVEDLRRFRAGEPVLARPVSAVGRAWRWGRRNPVVAGLSAVVLLLLVAVAVVASIGYVRATVAEGQAKGAQAQAETDRDHALTAEALASERLEQVTKEKERAEKAEKRAAEEAAIAKAVNEFLQKDLLGQADIGNQPLLGGAVERNRNIRVGELLDRAAKAIESKFAEQPLTEAAIRLTIGKTYRALGRFAESQPQLEQSVWLYTTQLGADHPSTLASKNDLAELNHYQGKFDRAESLYKEVFDGRMANLGADHLDTLESKNNLAVLYFTQGKYDRAEPLYLEALKGRTTQLGADHPDTLTSKNNLAGLYYTQGKVDQAEQLLQEVLAGRTSKQGADHPDTLFSKLNLAGLYYTQGKYERAETLFQEAVDGCTTKLGADHFGTLVGKNNLAALYHAQGKYDRAEPLLQEALKGRTTQLGADHPHTLTSKNNLAGLYRDQGKYDRAEPLYQEVLAASSTKLGADHPNTLTIKNNLALLYKAQGKYDRAEPLLRAVVDGVRKNPGLAHPTTQAFIHNLVNCYETMGQPAQGEPLLRELADFEKQKAGADSLEYADLLGPLCLNLLRQQKFTDAEPLLRDCLAIRGKKRPDEWRTFATQSMLGGSLLGQKKYAVAEPLLVKGYEGMKQREAKIPANTKDRLTEALQRLVQLYDATGQKDKAEEWREQLEQRKAAAKPPAQP
jgi:tetratricopeptide (TPR) repeat protein